MFLNNDPQIVIEVMQGTYISSVSCLLKYSTPVLDISEDLISKLQANSDWEHTKYKYMNFVNKLRMKNQTLKRRIKTLKLTNEDLIQRNQEMQEMNESRENWFDDEFKKKDEVLKMIELNNLGISKEKSELEKEIEAIKNRKAYKLIIRLEPIIDKLRRRKND
jgi:predicted RNase H-like nuclease (RuvC/YqgF family)